MGVIGVNTRPLEGPPPRLKTSPGATDCHIHFYLDGFTSRPGGPEIAELATPEDYALVQKRLGLERVVITQPNAYQLDNGATLSALDSIGSENARAVIAVSPDMQIKDIEALDARGVRGARIMDLPGGATPIARMKPVERLVREVGWSLIIQFRGRDIDVHFNALRSIEVNYVIDHVGRFMPTVRADDARIDTLLRLVDRGNAWFKVAGFYEFSESGGPDFVDVAPIARRMIAHAPERVIWGSNWPHVGVARIDYPDDAMLLDILLDWATPSDLEKILVENPAKLYGFS